MRISDWSSDVCSSDLAFDALAPVGVEPAFNGLLAQMAAAGTGIVVLALGQFPHDLLQLAMGQAFTADQGSEHAQAEYSHGIDRVHRYTPCLCGRMEERCDGKEWSLMVI